MESAEASFAPRPLLRTRLTARFGLAHPILSAPMAFIAGGALADAVSQAGGLGLVGGGYAGLLPGEPELYEELALLQGRRHGVGFITWALQQRPWVLEELLGSFTPTCIMLSFGDPRPFAQHLHQLRIPLLCQVQTLQQARVAVEAGAAAIVAQGQEAGGHGGARSTLPLVPELADYLARQSPDTLLLAAGGIMDGRGLAAALLLGADGVVMGSRFVACRQARTALAALQRIIQSNGDETVRTTAIDALRGLPWPDVYSYRVLHNALTRQWAHREAEARSMYGSWSERYEQARTNQDFDTAAVAVGEGVGLIDDAPDAQAIIQRTVELAALLLGRGTAQYDLPRKGEDLG